MAKPYFCGITAYQMKKIHLLFLVFAIGALAACSHKKNEGMIVYQLEYQLPDSLRSYGAYLPTEAIIYFKGDSAVNIQKTKEESTTVITYKPTGFMQVLLKSQHKSYVIDYDKKDQAEEMGNMPTFTYTPGKGVKTMAGYQAKSYTMKDKMSLDSTEAWFTHDIVIPPNSLTAVLDTTLGVPLKFSTNQNGIITKATVKEIKFEPVPEGVFTAPAGYEHLTPTQLREMPVE